MRRRALLAASAASLESNKQVVKIWLEAVNNGSLTVATSSMPVASDIVAFGVDGKSYWITPSGVSDGVMRGSTTIRGIAFRTDNTTIDDALYQIEDNIYIYKAVNK